MKKYKPCQWILLISLSVMTKISVSVAQLIPPCPICPSLDFLTDAAETVEGASAQLLAAQDKLQQLQGETLNQIKSYVENLGLDLKNTLFNKEKGEPNLASVRTIEKCKIADITDEDSIAEAFHTLFLTYPADILEKYPENQRAVKLAYKDKAVEFGNDAMIEMYITVRDLEEKMEALNAEYDELSACYVQGESSSASSCAGASSSEEELGVWSNYYKLNVIYDSMLKITEELMALRAQYEVAQAVLAGIEPVEETEEENAGEDQVSHNDVFRYVHTDSKAFAQMFSATQTSATKDTSIAAGVSNTSSAAKTSSTSIAAGVSNTSSAAKTSSTSIAAGVSNTSPVAKTSSTSLTTGVSNTSSAAKTSSTSLTTGVSNTSSAAKTSSTSLTAGVSNTSSAGNATETLGGMVLTSTNAIAEEADPDQEIVQATSYNLSSPFAGTAEQFQASMIANNAYQTVQKALKAHNLKQQLPEYRKVFIEYNKMKALHEKAIEQLAKSEACAVNYISKYYTDPVNVWYGDGCKLSGQTIVCDSDKSLTSETLKNLLPGDTLCEDDKSKICSSYGINSYSSREGFSGWLVSAYKTAKAEKTLDLDEEDFATNMTEEGVEADVSNLETLSEQYGTEAKSETSDSSLLRPSDEPKVEASIREQNLIAWQIGAETAKKLGEDMASGTSEWGTLKSEYPLWNDNKLVYEQYLTEKYKNMRIYIKTMDLRPVIAELALAISDLLPGTGTIYDISLSDIKNYNSSVLNKLLPLVIKDKENTNTFSAIEQTQQKVDDAMNNLRSSFNARMVSLSNDQASIYENLDNKNIELNDNKTTYNTAVQDKAVAEGNIEGQKVVIEISQARKAKSSDVMSNFETTAESSIEESNDTITQAGEKAESVLPQIETARESIDSLKLDLESKKDEIFRAKSDFAADASSMEAQSISTIKAAIAGMERTAAASSLGSSSHLSGLLNTTSLNQSIFNSLLSNIIGIADNGASNIRQQIINQIDAAAKRIENMREGRFDKNRYNEIINIHQQMLDGIKKPNFDISISGFSLSGLLTVSAVKELAEKIIVAEIFEDICENNTCYDSDDEYFVGLPPKSRDFMAPKIIMSSPTAPLREIVHFDAVDFDNIIKSDAWMTTGYDFLNQGQSMPQIWKQILGGKGFVERDIDVEEILSHNVAVLDNIKIETYPCTTGKYDIKIRNGGYYVTGATGNIEKFCSDVQSINIRRHESETTDDVWYDALIRFTSGGSAVGSLSQAPDKVKTSELATILTYKNGITFNNYIEQIMEFYENMETADDFSEEDQELEKFYKKELLTRNQFGNFLDFVEREMLYQDNLDQLGVKVDSNREKITEQLADIGYPPEENFDLSDDETYNEIMNALDSTKNTKVKEAVSLIRSIQPLNEVVEEKITKINNISGALQMDSDELIQLNDNMAGDSELSEEIKSKQTDNAARDKYDEEAQSAYEDNLNNFEEPYCANYD